MTVLTVTQVNTFLKAYIEESQPLQSIYICGEISNYKRYPSGHHYFTLKDEKSQLKCVMFASANKNLKFNPESGMKVICFGKIGVYERDGVYQLYVYDMQPQGIGSLTIAYEQLKAKLEKEGLFSDFYKKPIVKYPKKIGVATSNMGAAVEDIKNIISRRYPICEIVIVPTVVQGDNASADIVKSLKFLDCMGDIDTIIVGRGGGSIEDLWAFNTESVARAIFDCKTPVISAVGHETDYTISDFVADLRAPTPSAAAELAVPDIEEEKFRLQNMSASLDVAMNRIVGLAQQHLDYIKNASPLANASAMLEKHQTKIEGYAKSLAYSYKAIVERNEKHLIRNASLLNALSPLAVLSRGYSISKVNDKIVMNADELSVGDKIEIKFSKGSASADIIEVNKNE